MTTLLHMRVREGTGYGVYDDIGHLVATVRLNPTTSDDFELELQRWGTEPIHRLVTQGEALGDAGAIRAEELVQQYFPEDVVELSGDDPEPDRWLLSEPLS